jgi:PAS domain S-box-containing protein
MPMDTGVKRRLSARPAARAAPRRRHKPVAPPGPPPEGRGRDSKAKDNAFYASSFLGSPCAAVILDSSGGICGYNESFRALVQPKRLLAGNHPLSVHFDQGCISEFLCHLRECRMTGQPMSVAISIHGSGGGLVPVRLFSIFDKTCRAKRYRTIIINDADRQRALQKARQEHLAYAELIDSLDAIVWEMDCESGRTTYLSKKAERLFGKRARDWGKDRDFQWRQLHVDDRERVLNKLAQAVATRRDFVIEYRVFTEDRNLVWLQDSVTVHTVDDHLRIRGVAVDITERKTTEARAAQTSEELERRVEQRTAELTWTISELESFSYTLSHDMRAPLRSIEGYATLLAEATGSKKSLDTMDCLRRIIRSAQRLDDLVQDVLKFSGLAKEPIELKPLDLNTIIPALADEAPGFKGAGARIEVAKLLPVTGHAGFLSQCVSNLLSNAAKFVEPGVAPRVRIWTERRGGFVQLWIADNGIGIAPEDHVRIFKVFERCHRQRKFEGSGLGLSIVQRAAERMGGTVGVESAPGQGSKFWIQLAPAYD